MKLKYTSTNAAAAPLSYQQERVWRLPNCEEDIIPPLALRLTGRVDPDLLARAFTDLTRRQAVFRTRIEAGGAPRQITSAQPEINFGTINLAGLPPEDRDRATAEIIRRESAVAFLLDRAPLMRARLVHLSDDEHVLFFIVHHIIGDLWAMKILWKELALMYSAGARGSSFEMPELPVQYTDYAISQRDWFTEHLLCRGLDYLQQWSRKAVELPPFNLPVSGPAATRRGGVIACSLPPGIASQIRLASREYGVTVFMMLLGLFQMFLRQYTRTPRFLVAAMIANRPSTELESLVGVFSTSLALLMDAPAETGLCEIMAQTRDVCLDALANQSLPMWQFSELAGQNIDSALLRPRISFTMQTAPPKAAVIPGVDAAAFAINGAGIFEGDSRAIAAFEQAWEIWEAGDTYRILVIYRQCFERRSIEDMMQSFVNTIECSIVSGVK